MSGCTKNDKRRGRAKFAGVIIFLITLINFKK